MCMYNWSGGGVWGCMLGNGRTGVALFVAALATAHALYLLSSVSLQFHFPFSTSHPPTL